MKHPPNENGGLSTAAIALVPAKEPDVFGDGVNAERLSRWLDMAIVMHRMGATDPVEFQRLGMWLQRMRRAVG